MVKKFFALIDREIRGLHEAAYVLAGFALLSQVLALLRDRTFAHVFGAGETLDMYFAAFRVPDTLFAILTLFISSFALIPLLSKRDEGERPAVVRSLLIIFGAVAVPLSAVAVLLLDTLMPFFVPGFSPEALYETTTLARILLLQPLILGLSSILSAYVQTERRFALFALAPIFYNIGIIFGVFVFYPTLGTEGLAWGVVLGALLHLGVQFRPRYGVTGVRGRAVTLRELYREVIRPSVPRALALFSNQLLFIVFAAISTVIAVGSVSALTFAYNLQSVPLTVIGLSYASALFPALAALVSRGEWDSYVKEVWATVRHILFWLLPASLLCIVLRAHIVRVVLGSGAFSWDDTRLTAALFALFVVSLVAQAALLVFSRAYYAAGKTLLPVLLNVGGAFLAGVSAYYALRIASEAPFLHWFIEALFRVSDVPGTLVLLIPFSYSAAMLTAALAFAVIFSVQYGFDRQTLSSVLISFSASVIGGASAYLALQAFGPLLPTYTFLGIFTQGAAAGLVGFLGWVGTLRLLKSTELSDVLVLIRAKLAR